MRYSVQYMGTNLKKALFFLSFSVFLLNRSIFSSVPAVVMAQMHVASGETRIEKGGEEVIRSLGVETTGILPSNPFYFFKEWGRGIRRALSFSPLKRAELQLDIANEQAAEIVKLVELNIEASDAYIRALENYDASLALFRERLAVLQSAAIPDRFSLVLIDRMLKHADIFDRLYAVRGENDKRVRTVSRASVMATAETVAALAKQVGNSERIAGYMRTVAGKQSGRWRELKAVEFINRLEMKLASEAGDELAKLRANLLLQLTGRLKGATLEDFIANEDADDALETLSGASLERLRALDEVREYAMDSDIKNYLSLVRSKLFDRIRSEGAVAADDARALVAAVTDIITKTKAKLDENERTAVVGVWQGLERARFANESAEKFIEEGVYASAYGQASSALAVAERAYVDVLLGNGDMMKDVQSLKKDFDNLGERVYAMGVSKTDNLELFAAMSDAERAVAKAADLMNAGASAEKVFEASRLAKRLIGAAMALLEAKHASTAVMPAVEIKEGVGAKIVVTMNGGQFIPAVAKIKKGDTVVWKNADDVAHQIVSSAAVGRETLQGFGTEESIVAGGEYAYTFERRGIWKYHDKLHPEMTGVVDVE